MIGSEQDLMKHYLNIDMKEGEPERDIGIFKKFCPVKWTNNNVLEEGQNDLCVTYKVSYFN